MLLAPKAQLEQPEPPDHKGCKAPKALPVRPEQWGALEQRARLEQPGKDSTSPAPLTPQPFTTPTM